MGRMQPNLMSGKLRDHRHPKRMDLTVTNSYWFSLIFYCTFPVRLEQKHTCKAGYCWNEIINNGYALIHGVINTWYVILCSNMTGHWKFGDVIIVYWRIYASLDLNELTHWGRVTHICVSKLTIFGSDNGFAPANWTLGNKLQWNRNRNLYIFIQENACENVVWKMAAILSRTQCVNHTYGNSVYWSTGYCVIKPGHNATLFVSVFIIIIIPIIVLESPCGGNPFRHMFRIKQFDFEY